MYNSVVMQSPVCWRGMCGFSHTNLFGPSAGRISYPTLTITLADSVMIILTRLVNLSVCQIFLVVVFSVSSETDICSNIINTHTTLYTSETLNNYYLISLTKCVDMTCCTLPQTE